MIHSLVKLLNASLRRVRRRRAQLFLYKQRREYQKELSSAKRAFKKRNVYDRVDFANTEWADSYETQEQLTQQNKVRMLFIACAEIAFVCRSQSFLT
jgi:hypothetical protein